MISLQLSVQGKDALRKICLQVEPFLAAERDLAKLNRTEKLNTMFAIHY